MSRHASRTAWAECVGGVHVLRVHVSLSVISLFILLFCYLTQVLKIFIYYDTYWTPVTLQLKNDSKTWSTGKSRPGDRGTRAVFTGKANSSDCVNLFRYFASLFLSQFSKLYNYGFVENAFTPVNILQLIRNCNNAINLQFASQCSCVWQSWAITKKIKCLWMFGRKMEFVEILVHWTNKAIRMNPDSSKVNIVYSASNLYCIPSFCKCVISWLHS